MGSSAIAADAGGSRAASDDALVAAARTDPDRFTALYERYLPQIYRYLRTHSATDEEAADLTQVVFMRAWQALPGFRPGKAPIAAWLLRIARNAAIDAHRRNRPALSWDGLPEALQPAVDDLPPELGGEQAARLARLRLLVRELDPARRELLALRFAAGLTSAQIGVAVGKSEAAVKKQLTRIIASLKEQYFAEFPS
jgi:RNA polymerase sigma-70 factor (ECF subfamily)